MNKLLRAEIWEIQIILYLILAQMVETEWMAWLLRIWALISFIGMFMLLIEHRKENK